MIFFEALREDDPLAKAFELYLLQKVVERVNFDVYDVGKILLLGLQFTDSLLEKRVNCQNWLLHYLSLHLDIERVVPHLDILFDRLGNLEFGGKLLCEDWLLDLVDFIGNKLVDVH